MFGKKTAGAENIAVVDIGSGSAGVAILQTGKEPRLLSFARENLPLEDRSKDALRSGIVQALSAAGEKALAACDKAAMSASRISGSYCVVGSPWSRSFAGVARSQFERETIITDGMIGALAKQTLSEQKEIDKADLLEANVLRVLLNGYQTGEPAGKRALTIDLFTLASDCDAEVKSRLSESLTKLFPAAKPTWRSGARAILAVMKEIQPAETCLVVRISGEATDLISVRKGILDRHVLLEQGLRQILSALAKGKPIEETLSLMEMLEKDECETEACESLRQSIAKAEPDLAHVFGEAFGKLSTPRKLPDELVLIAPPQVSPWLSRFFARIDFTQFTATTRPFSITAFSGPKLSGIPRNNPAIFDDPGLSIACDLVNIERSS